MPPKASRAGQSTIRSNYTKLALQQWPEYADPRDASSEGLSDNLLRAAYGLPTVNAERLTAYDTSRDLKSPCDNRWKGKQRETESPQVARRRASTASSVEVIVIESDDQDDPIQHPDRDDQDDDDNDFQVKPVKTRAKTKGKGKAKDPHECFADNCNPNPRCLNWLGQEQWERDVKAFKSFAKANGLGDGYKNDREPGTPVGLKNLGATCYANSFLQSSPVFQLQVLFSFLQSSRQAVYDPEPFVTSLRLDKGEQQDAQEFSKLFMSLLDHEFKKQGEQAQNEDAAKKVGDLMTEQFEGSVTYGTRCEACGNASETTSAFSELEISLKNRSTLEERIKASLADENLSGDNQYFCEQCQAKRDAVRYTELNALPPVLHFSLLRFVFSMKDLTRSKSQALTSYPLELDMGQFLPPDARGAQPSVWYDLKGVLMHKGKSAHHGHYVAQVHDDVDKKWYLFDDESVTPIDDLNGPDLYDEEGDRIEGEPSTSQATSSSKKKKPGAGFKWTKDGSVMPQSSDAYMLIYTKRVERAEGMDEPVPPPLASMRVEQLDEKYFAEQQTHLEKQSKLRESFNQIKEQKRSVYTVWDQFEQGDEGTFVARGELKRWMEDGLVSSSKKKRDGSNETAEAKEGCSKEVEAKKVVGAAGCSKESEAPNGVRAQRADEAEKSGGDVEMTDNSAEQNGGTASAAEASGSSSPSNDAGAEGTKTTAEDQDAKVEAKDLEHNDKGVTTESDSATAEEQAKTLDNASVTCKHGNADPFKAEQLKRISKLGLERLEELGYKVEPRLDIPGHLCRDCAWGIAAEHAYQQNHERRLKEFINVPKSTDARYYISIDWLKDWKRPSPGIVHTKYTLHDILPDEDIFDHEVVCPHGDLHADGKWDLISKEAVDVLKKAVPAWIPVMEDSLPSCKRCRETDKAEASGKKALKEEMVAEKKTLKALHNQLTQASLTSGFVLTGEDHVIPMTWAREWSRWLKGGNSQRPGRLDNSRFLCKHGRFSIDLEREAQQSSSIVTVSNREWNMLRETYEAGPPIKVWHDDDTRQYLSSPSTCTECIQENLRNFMETRVAIRMLSDEDFDAKGDRKIDASTSPTLTMTGKPMHPFAKPTQQLFNSPRGTRSSARISNKPFMQMKRQLTYIDMLKTDTVKDLRMRIAEKLDIPTICQRLYFNYQELDSDQTVTELNLDSDAILELRKVEEVDMDVDSLDVVDPDQRQKGVKGSAKRKRDEGFGGTGLFGWDQQAEDGPAKASTSKGATEHGSATKVRKTSTDGSPGRKVKPGEPASNGWKLDLTDDDEMVGVNIACPSCTFNNSALMTHCEMCDSELPS
ncbi:hypothetical protein ACM66B_005115 [Microbotryomycetes sp. NB124-2]